MRTLVLGGYGAVGAHIVAELGRETFVAGRNPARADIAVDLTDDNSYRAALTAIPEVDVVVNASGAEDVRLAILATDAGMSFVDITASTAYVAELERLVPASPVVVGVGIAPGLTGMLAAAAHRAAPGPVDLAVLLGAGERHGVAATAWTYDLLGRRFADPGGGSVRNFTRPKAFTLPGFGTRRLYRADFSDQHTLTAEFGVPVRTYFGLDSRLATSGLAALTWAPPLGRLKSVRGMHFPGSDRWLALAQAADGRTRWAAGRSQARGTGVIAAATARAAMDLPPGVHHGHRVLNLGTVPDRVIELG
ncbi:hypothetical protein [Amycolatopsis sp. NPDC059021]|uniref:hypothetical protein n=1 Tax=Amycolatopsis sp. NPDC059021 TaxID=3346704 RepID=UPI00366FF253